jgi:CBS domain-containing protein
MSTFTARDVMNREVLTVRVDLSVRELAAFLTANQISGAPVVDREGKLVGVVSLTDVAEYDADRSDLAADGSDPARIVRGWEDRIDPEDVRPLHLETSDLLVRDIMTPVVYTVPEGTPVSRIAHTMIAGRIHRLFVTRRGRVVGIVTSLDLVRLLADGRIPARTSRTRGKAQPAADAAPAP